MSNVFEGFGLFSQMVPVGTTTSKVSEKGAKKKEEKKQKEVPKKKEEKYKTPLSVFFDSLATVTFDEDGELTTDELFSGISKKTGIALFNDKKEAFSLNKLKEGRYLLRPKYMYKYEKGTAGKKLLLQGMNDLDTVMTPDEEGNITAEMVKEYIKDNYHIDTTIYLVDDVYIPEGKNQITIDYKEMRFPIRTTSLVIPGEFIEITQEDYSVIASETKEVDLLSGIEIKKVTLENAIKTLYPDYADDLSIQYDKEQNLIAVNHKSQTGNTTPAAVKEEKKYPTDATISLILTKIKLDSSMFGGKKEVGEKELIKYINKDYPEFSQERTELLYDKKRNLITPIFKSGKKGSYKLEDCYEYRLESTDLMSVKAYKGPTRNIMGCCRGTVEYKLPKIPFSILREIIYFFWTVYICYRTEAVAHIFYNKETEEYELYIPVQYVQPSSVEFEHCVERETDDSLIFVMEIHSHAQYSAFWSSADNDDEKCHRLYAVVGDIPAFHYDASHIRVRAATGGLCVQANPNDIFEFPEDMSDIHCSLHKVHPYERDMNK